MNIIAVDDERAGLLALERAIRQGAESAEVSCFDSAGAALDYAGRSAVDVAFLDVELGETSGLTLARKLKALNVNTNIIFVTGYEHYAGDAFALHASGYVLKPIEPERVRRELENLRTPVSQPRPGLRVRCFGTFEVFFNGEPVAFRLSKSKELFAYLIDRMGAGVTTKELAAILWEDEAYTRRRQKQLSKLVAETLRTLDSVGAGGLIVKMRGIYAVDVTKVRCDYYDYNQGNAVAINSYRGEYMTGYSWGEFTAGQLTQQDQSNWRNGL